MTASGFVPDWPCPANVKTLQTTRLGGSSSGSYAELNLALHVEDDPACVATNRRRLIEDWSLPAEPKWLKQVHGTRVVNLDQPWRGEADGAVTATEGQICVVMTADCLPVLLTDRGGSRVGAVHCGWRGLAAGILGQALSVLGSRPTDVLAWLGPAISQPAYEVGSEVRDAFVARGTGLAGCFVRNARGRWQADLYALARMDLRAAGVDQIFGVADCTFRGDDRYFSHRRQAPCGRMATMIWRS
jgi:YfiH family protein